MRRVVPILLVGAFVAGCAQPGPARPGADDPETVTRSINLSGYPPEFQRGFREGCAAARANDRSGKPQGDAQYAVGWNDGYDYCSTRR